MCNEGISSGVAYISIFKHSPGEVTPAFICLASSDKVEANDEMEWV
jgi:hypothetical protein